MLLYLLVIQLIILGNIINGLEKPNIIDDDEVDDRSGHTCIHDAKVKAFEVILHHTVQRPNISFRNL